MSTKVKFGTIWLYFKLPKIIYKDQIDVFWGTQHCLPKRNKYTKKVKYLLTIHDIALEKFKNIGSYYNTIIQKIFLRKSCKNADRIIADSKATKADLINILNIADDKIEVVYLGINEKKDVEITQEIENEIINKYNLEKSKFIFFLSTIEPRKNLDIAIKAFELYKENAKDNLKFIISGGVGWKCKKTLQLIENSEYKEGIIRTGYISKEEKEYFFKNCEAFVYPSLYEGFGLPILEAMQYGALVITSNVSSMPEVGGDAAIYLKNTNDYKELSDIFSYILNMKKEEKEKYIQRGYSKVKEFRWDDCTKKVHNLLLK